MPDLTLVIEQAPIVKLVVNPTPQIKSVIQNAQGPSGASGASVPPFEFLIPQQTWVINHNLARRPLVGVFTVGGVEMWAEVQHISVNQVAIYFDDPTAGYAICS